MDPWRKLSSTTNSRIIGVLPGKLQMESNRIHSPELSPSVICQKYWKQYGLWLRKLIHIVKPNLKRFRARTEQCNFANCRGILTERKAILKTNILKLLWTLTTLKASFSDTSSLTIDKGGQTTIYEHVIFNGEIDVNLSPWGSMRKVEGAGSSCLPSSYSINKEPDMTRQC